MRKYKLKISVWLNEDEEAIVELAATRCHVSGERFLRVVAEAEIARLGTAVEVSPFVRGYVKSVLNYDLAHGEG